MIRTVNIKTFFQSRYALFVRVLLLSWFYALCSQCIIPHPFGAVPFSLQPLPLFFCAFYFGWPAVHAYVLYLLQGCMGAPFFAYGLGGMGRLCGPTGGYLIGFGVAMILIASFPEKISVKKLLSAQAIVYICGLAQLWMWVGGAHLFSVGLYPFLLPDLVKLYVLWLFSART